MLTLCKQIFVSNPGFMILQLSASDREELNYESGISRQRRCFVCSTKEKRKSTIKILIEFQVNLCSEKCWMLRHKKK